MYCPEQALSSVPQPAEPHRLLRCRFLVGHEALDIGADSVLHEDHQGLRRQRQQLPQQRLRERLVAVRMVLNQHDICASETTSDVAAEECVLLRMANRRKVRTVALAASIICTYSAQPLESKWENVDGV